MDDYSVITIEPSAPHTHTVVFLHGRGDDARHFMESLIYLQDSENRAVMQIFPTFKWVFPEAPYRQSVAPMGNRCHQWFDIWNVQDFSQREELQAEGLKESVQAIRRILVQQAKVLNQQWDKIILAGISQGAATAVHTLINLKLTTPTNRLGALLGFSCRLPFPGRSLDDTRTILDLDNRPADNLLIRNTPVLLEHCINDHLVLVQNGRALRDALASFGAAVTWIEYPNGGHWFNWPQGVDDLTHFLEQNVLGQKKTMTMSAETDDVAMDLA